LSDENQQVVHRGQKAVATNSQLECIGSTAEPQRQMSRTVALIDLRPGDSEPGSIGSDSSAVVFDLALRKIERVVRGDDRVCPFGISRVAIAFGPDAEAVTPKTLGERLARAVRHSPETERRTDVRSAKLTTDVQRQRGPDGDGEGAGNLSSIGTAHSSTTVTVDRFLRVRTPLHVPGVGNLMRGGGTRTPVRPTMPIPLLRHRTVVRYSTGRFAKYGTRHDDASTVGNGGTILVVGPSRTSGATPGLSAVAASALAERLGFEVEAVALACDDELVLDIHGVGLDLVVLVVEGEREPANDTATWLSSNWNITAQLAAKYDAQGIGVLAVGAGAGAGALAGCAAQGATVLLDHDDLEAELRHLCATQEADDSWVAREIGSRVPQPIGSLVQLTTSERRVLFYLTTGKAAQDIAYDLVVSVTTVRSHIRSILRKLGVRSQLAAVAIANSRDFEHTQAGGSTADTQREPQTPRAG
jgi:DNA-binding NarL/FixJ family response regulator